MNVTYLFDPRLVFQTDNLRLVQIGTMHYVIEERVTDALGGSSWQRTADLAQGSPMKLKMSLIFALIDRIEQLQQEVGGWGAGV